VDLRTKLVFTLVAVALVSMVVLGVFAFEASRSMLQALALRQLESVAEGKKDDLERAQEAWRDRARLISSRTQLRLSLRHFLDTSDREELDRMRRILDDARGSVRSLLYAAVLDPSGLPLAVSGAIPDGVELPPVLLGEVGQSAAPVARAGGDRLVVTLDEPMRLDGVPIGITRVVLDAVELGAIARDYTGLGETGETLVVRADAEGAEILTPLRDTTDSEVPRRIPKDRADSPSLRAVRGESGTLVGVDDHSERAVWASTRPLARPGWGVVVKIDAEEAEKPALELRETLVRLALSLSALAVVAGRVTRIRLEELGRN